MKQSPHRISVLAIRLVVWFILLSSLPILVLIFFVRHNVQATFVNLENSHHYQMAGMLAGQVALSDNIEDVQRLLSMLEGSEQTAFILSPDGTYLAHVDGSKINATAEDDLSPDAVRTILTETDGLYSERSNPYVFAFTPVPGQDAVVVVAGKVSTLSAAMRELERESYLELLISIVIVLVGCGAVIWLLVGLPVRKLTYAAEQLGDGRLDVQVDSDIMTDDLKVLATTFNTMVNRIRELVEDLEQRIAARTEELSASFELTMLTSSGQQNLPEILEPAMTRILEVSHSRAICIHLLTDNDAEVALHLIAQRNLSIITEEGRLQLITPSGDFARWFGKISDPIVTTTLAQATVVPPDLKLTDFQSYLGVQIRIKGSSQGLLSCFRRSGQGFAVDEISLLAALADQLGVIAENHRLRRQSEELAIMEERQRLARDLHDSVTQSLYSLALLADSGQRLARAGSLESAEDYLADLSDIALQSVKEMRLLVYELRPPLLAREGLVGALQQRLDAVEGRAGVEARLLVEGDVALPAPVEEALYGIAREALNNALKHATVTWLTVRIVADGERVELEIADNGVGFDPGGLGDTGGMGLANMQERADGIDADLAILSAPGEGTKVKVCLEVS